MAFPLRATLRIPTPRVAHRRPVRSPCRKPLAGVTVGMLRHQQGAALIVALILLLIMSILGISSVRTTVMEEKMAAASYDRSLAFQAAEAALRAGEAVALAQSTASPKNAAFPNAGLYTNANTNCETSPCNAQGLCAQPDPDCTSRWLEPGFGHWVNAPKVNDIAGTPQYFVEYLGNTFPCTPGDTTSPASCTHYRITARSNPGQGRANVVLQSIFLTN